MNCLLPKTFRFTVFAGLLWLSVEPAASAATVSGGGIGTWKSFKWSGLPPGQALPGAADDVTLYGPYNDIQYDDEVGALKSLSSQNAKLTLRENLRVTTLNMRQGTISDGGKTLIVGTLTNNSGPWFDGNGGIREGKGGNLFIGDMMLARTGLFTFYPGDTISGKYSTAVINNTWPEVTVTQDPVSYADRLGKGLSFEGDLADAISLGPLGTPSASSQAKIKLNWDDGLTGPIDWTLRWRGDRVAKLREYFQNGRIVLGSLPNDPANPGRKLAFDPQVNIFYDGTYSYVGFNAAPPPPQVVLSAPTCSPGGQITAALPSAGPGDWVALYAVANEKLEVPNDWMTPPGAPWVASLPGSSPKQWTVVCPSTPGAYRVRYYVGWKLVATSGALQVS